ncbi:hypothetical protein AYR56_05260 [Loigolactobacillus backii]|uniref:Uncharacterized protein n=1 Tax=Loigolactobacillus backii TaxID=375175 RepID=A0A192H4S8_9LACO|nr:hypothetical protein [Loigolactobacillus backii]ANK63385.1 hypothetical protein AYR53_11745 [Loigolactobacillus backii]ANK69610.1 hypothetical protein AYR56_05260 [Loigolactobacillus backii]
MIDETSIALNIDIEPDGSVTHLGQLWSSENGSLRTIIKNEVRNGTYFELVDLFKGTVIMHEAEFERVVEYLVSSNFKVIKNPVVSGQCY